MAYLNVRVSAGSREDGITGWLGDLLRVKVRAAAERGKANEAACRLIANRLGLAPILVTIAKGAASRDKLLFIEGLTDAEVRTKLNYPML